MDAITIPRKDFSTTDPNQNHVPRCVVVMVDSNSDEEAFQTVRSHFDELPKFTLRLSSDVSRHEELRNFFTIEDQRKMEMHDESEDTKRVEKVTTAIRRLHIDGDENKETEDGRSPVYVTSSRRVYRAADGVINIVQEIFFYADGGVDSLAGKQLKEVYSDPTAQVRGRIPAVTSARVFVGERLIRMLISTAIRPNSSDSLEFDDVFHLAEHDEAHVVPIAFGHTLDRAEGEHPAVEFDLQSPIVVTLKQRVIKNPGEQYKVVQAIELRANESTTRPTQELNVKRKCVTENGTAQFRERIFAGTDVIRVDRYITFVCDRPTLSLSERREYMPSHPVAPRRNVAAFTQTRRV